MNFLLDTCVISDFIKGESSTLDTIKSLSPSVLAISTVTLMEINYGLSLNLTRAKKIQPIIHSFLEKIHILNFSTEDAKESTLIRALLKQQGCPIGPYDILLAGTALNRKLTLVSANTNEFNRIEGLKLENWRKH